MNNDSSSFAQRSQEKLYFDHKDMDYYLSWVMGRQIYGGSDPEECLDVAARIEDGNVESWQREWRTFADQMADQAHTALSNGDTAGAKSAFLRACTYYRAPLFIMGPEHPAFRDNREKMRACFRQAAPLFDPPIEPIQVPFQGHSLFGYAQKVDHGDQKRPTLLVIGGIETFAEDCYLMIGPTALERGYNVVTVDLPGQGVNPEQGLYFTAKMQEPVSTVLDDILHRPEIDPDRLAVYGFSWGGHIVFKAAEHDRRIKAMIANPAMPNVFRAALAQQQGHNRSDPVAKVVFQQIAWRMGLKISLNPKDIIRRFGKAYDYLAHGKANLKRIECPTLCLAGEGEAPITLQIARECIEQLPHPQKKLVIFTKSEGGEAHCQVNNLKLPSRVIFDWLDEVLGVGD